MVIRRTGQYEEVVIHLRDVLYEALADASTGKAAKRLMIALAYKDGVSVETLSERYGIPRSRVYYWLDRFEATSIDDAIQDEHRPGRPSELTDEERSELRTNVAQSPQMVGFNATSWSPELIQECVADEYGVE